MKLVANFRYKNDTLMTQNRLQTLLNFLEANPNDAFILFALAKEYEKLQQPQEALTYFQRLEKEHPDYVGTYYHLGKLLEQLDQPEKAFATYKTGMAIAKKQGDQHALSELAGAKLNLGDDEDFE